jgi:hypothetical protein
VKAETKGKKEGDIFEAKKEEYKPSEQRKKDQTEVDKQVITKEQLLVDCFILPLYFSTGRKLS